MNQLKLPWLLVSICLLLHQGTIAAQPTRCIPFASQGNRIELAIANASHSIVSGVKVAVTNLPDWILFKTPERSITTIQPEKEEIVTFEFSVTKNAPVGKVQVLNFAITTQAGETWNKEITISVNAPDRFSLYQNYPNPFNPTTTIGYQLSASAHTKLSIYNMLGQVVATLVDELRDAGYHQESWTAENVPSGVYFYRLQSGSYVQMRKLLVLR